MGRASHMGVKWDEIYLIWNISYLSEACIVTEETHLHLIDPGDSYSSGWRKTGPHDYSCPNTLKSLFIFSSLSLV